MSESEQKAVDNAQQEAHIFRKALPMQVMLHEVLRALGPVDGQSCLVIGSRNGNFSSLLRQQGGTWSDVVEDAQSERAVSCMVADEIYRFENGVLPFKNKHFDAILVLNFLEIVADDYSFIEECHRVLKADGRMVVNARHLKGYSLLQPLERLCRLNAQSTGQTRGGYTESELFRILKNGFNVLNVRSYSRFFLLLVDLFVRLAARRRRSEDGEDADLRTAYSVAGPFYRIADQLDLLIFFTRGYRLIASAKRRAWRPRNAPVLVDGRSISEAVLSRPGV